jgi:hypothetical protein
MDNLDRMYRHLVRTIRSRFPQYLGQPFDVGELYQTILPYRHYRRELGLETNDDYEITLTELLSGARDYLVVDDHMRDVLKAALAATNPDPSAFKQFATVHVSLSPAALRSLEAGPAVDPGTPDIAMPFASSTSEQLARAAAPPAAAPSASAASTATAPMSATVPPPAPAPPPSAPPRISTKQTAPSVVATPNTPPAVASIARLSGGISAPGTGSIVPNAGERCRSCDGELPEGRAITFCPHCGQNLTTMNCPACGSELELGWNFCPTCGRPAASER